MPSPLPFWAASTARWARSWAGWWWGSCWPSSEPTSPTQKTCGWRSASWSFCSCWSSSLAAFSATCTWSAYERGPLAGGLGGGWIHAPGGNPRSARRARQVPVPRVHLRVGVRHLHRGSQPADGLLREDLVGQQRLHGGRRLLHSASGDKAGLVTAGHDPGGS